MSDNARTNLGLENEQAILAELDGVIQKWAHKLQKEKDSIRSSVAYMWKDNERKAEQSWRNYMGPQDMGPYDGR